LKRHSLMRPGGVAEWSARTPPEQKIPRFEPRQGVRCLDLYTLQFCWQNLIRIVILCILENKWLKKIIDDNVQTENKSRHLLCGWLKHLNCQEDCNWLLQLAYSQRFDILYFSAFEWDWVRVRDFVELKKYWPIPFLSF
jgi:hypothetical protein